MTNGMTMARCAVALMAACVILTAGAVRAEDHEKPDATIHLEAKSVAIGVGFSWGSGVLTYKGKSHYVDVDGLTLGQVGVNEATAAGEVFKLKKLEDFDGNYTAVAGGATVGGGGGGLIMENQNGVRIKLKATTQGVSLTAGASGVKLTLKK